MKSFQDYLVLKEDTGRAVAQNMIDFQQSLSGIESENLIAFIKAAYKILTNEDNKASQFVEMVMRLSGDSELNLNRSALVSAAKKLIDSSSGTPGLGDQTGSANEITPPLADKMGSF